MFMVCLGGWKPFHKAFLFLTTTGCSTGRFAPSFYHVLPKQHNPPAEAKLNDMTPKGEPAGATAAVTPNATASTVTTPKHLGKKSRR